MNGHATRDDDDDNINCLKTNIPLRVTRRRGALKSARTSTSRALIGWRTNLIKPECREHRSATKETKAIPMRCGRIPERTMTQKGRVQGSHGLSVHVTCARPHFVSLETPHPPSSFHSTAWTSLHSLCLAFNKHDSHSLELVPRFETSFAIVAGLLFVRPWTRSLPSYS